MNFLLRALAWFPFKIPTAFGTCSRSIPEVPLDGTHATKICPRWESFPRAAAVELPPPEPCPLRWLMRDHRQQLRVDPAVRNPAPIASALLNSITTSVRFNLATVLTHGPRFPPEHQLNRRSVFSPKNGAKANPIDRVPFVLFSWLLK
uniref:(northern house mosquito) hypothetical protein n=1 Tax=Culex pipiens TaxID=7175 RepID=A0A8D8AW52_CULPI